MITKGVITMKHTTLLKVTSILCIIGASLSLMIGILAVSGVAFAATLGTNLSILGYASVAILVIGSIVEMIAGIRGINACNNVAKAKGCIILGIISIVLVFVSLGVGYAYNPSDYTVIGIMITIICNMILPVLYLLGANKVKVCNC